jgi:hypothetical protein
MKRSRRSGAKAAPAQAAASAETLFDMSMPGLSKTFERLNLSGVAGTIAEGRRKDLAALIAANKKSYEGLAAVVARQTAMLKNAVSEWQSMAQGIPPGGARPGSPNDEVANALRWRSTTFRTRRAAARSQGSVRNRSPAHHGERRRGQRADPPPAKSTGTPGVPSTLSLFASLRHGLTSIWIGRSSRDR